MYSKRSKQKIDYLITNHTFFNIVKLFYRVLFVVFVKFFKLINLVCQYLYNYHMSFTIPKLVYDYIITKLSKIVASVRIIRFS